MNRYFQLLKNVLILGLGQFASKIVSYFLLPLYTGEGKTQLVIAIGCTGGKHRSVAITEALAEHIRATQHRVLVSHRDIEKA